MAADGNTDDGYLYHPGHSTFGIIFNEGIQVNLFRWFPRNLHLRPFRVPGAGPVSNFIACSSSRGLVALWHSNTNLYHIVHSPVNVPDNIASTVLPPPPRPHHPHNTHVVLATIPERSRYHLICAIRRGPADYTFDIYTSNTGRWHSTLDEHAVSWGFGLGFDIKPNSGVSCGKYAFWLTDTPGMVLGFDVFFRWAIIFKGPRAEDAVLDHPATNLQLGRVGEQLGLVLVNGRDRKIELHTMNTDGITSEEVEWDPGFVAVLEREELLNLNNGIVVRVLPTDGYMARWASFDWDSKVDRDISHGWMPRPVRFESFKMEVLLWVAGRVLVWEENAVENSRQRLVPTRRSIGQCITDGFPHVCIGSLLGDFPVMNNADQEMNNAEQEMNNADQEMGPDSSVGSN